MIPLSAVEGTGTVACVRSPRLGELTAGISGVAEENEECISDTFPNLALVITPLSASFFTTELRVEPVVAMAYLLQPEWCCQVERKTRNLLLRKHHS